jgi:tetratricopeptide (TPR) repeat protein
LEPENLSAVVNKGVLHNEKKDPAAALDMFELALRIQPGNPIALFNRGLALLQLGRVNEARDSLEFFVTTAPKEFAALAQQARATLEAIDAAVATPSEVQNWVAEAELQRMEGHWEQAVQLYDRALAVTPGHIPALKGKGHSLNGLRRFADALPCFEAVLAQAPDDLETLISKARSLDAAMRYAEALETIEHALRVDPHSSVAWIQKGNTLGTLERLEEALGCFDAASEHDPENPAVYFFKGMAEEQLSRKTDAEASFGTFLSMAPPVLKAQIGYAKDRLAKLVAERSN